MALKDLKAESVVLNNQKYVVSPFPFREGIKVQAKLSKYLGPVLKVFQAANDEADIIEVLPEAIDELTRHMDEDEVVELMDRLVSNTYLNGSEPVDLDRHFSGDYMNAWNLIYKIVEINFGSFIKGLIGNLPEQDQESLTTATSEDSEKN